LETKVNNKVNWVEALTPAVGSGAASPQDKFCDNYENCGRTQSIQESVQNQNIRDSDLRHLDHFDRESAINLDPTAEPQRALQDVANAFCNAEVIIQSGPISVGGQETAARIHKFSYSPVLELASQQHTLPIQPVYSRKSKNANKLHVNTLKKQASNSDHDTTKESNLDVSASFYLQKSGLVRAAKFECDPAADVPTAERQNEDLQRDNVLQLQDPPIDNATKILIDKYKTSQQ